MKERTKHKLYIAKAYVKENAKRHTTFCEHATVEGGRETNDVVFFLFFFFQYHYPSVKSTRQKKYVVGGLSNSKLSSPLLSSLSAKLHVSTRHAELVFEAHVAQCHRSKPLPKYTDLSRPYDPTEPNITSLSDRSCELKRETTKSETEHNPRERERDRESFSAPILYQVFVFSLFLSIPTVFFFFLVSSFGSKLIFRVSFTFYFDFFLFGWGCFYCVEMVV